MYIVVVVVNMYHSIRYQVNGEWRHWRALEAGAWRQQHQVHNRSVSIQYGLTTVCILCIPEINQSNTQ